MKSYLLLFSIVLGLIYLTHRPSDTVPKAQAVTGSILMAIAGDWDDKFTGATGNTLRGAMAADVDLIGFIGDLSYAGSDSGESAGIATATTWCESTTGIINTKPTFFVAGDHDSFIQDGDVRVYDDTGAATDTRCLRRPTTSAKVSNLTGTYPWLYYFDVTDSGITVRVVGSSGDASGDLVSAYPDAAGFMDGYQKGGPSYNFLEQAFNDAKAKNYWTVYANHEPCIDPGKDNPGQWCYDVVDLLADSGVDVMVTGSSHNAWLTMQMNKGPECPTIMINGKSVPGSPSMNPKCAKTVANNAYIEGQGWINAHAGTGGKDGSSSYNCRTGPDVAFVVPGTCGDVSGSDGAVYLSFTNTAIQGTFKKNAGGNLYEFSMARSGTVVPTATPAGRISSPTPTTGGPSPTPTTAGPTLTPNPNCPQKTLGDSDCDGQIKLADYDVWRREFYGELTTKTGDFTADNRVSLADFEIWRRNFQPSVTPTPTP